MNCPKCNLQMEKGFIQSGRTVFYTIEKKYLFFLPSSDDVVLTRNNFTNPTGVAYNCKKCKIILFDYGSKTNY